MSSASSTISAISHGGTTFTLFPKLPQELRVKIWEYALPEGPRVVKVYYQGQQSMEPKFKIRAEVSDPATSLLRVSVEARIVALKAYPLAFQTPLLKPLHFNFEKDTLSFYGPNALKYFVMGDFTSPSDENTAGAEMKKIRHVVYTGSLVIFNDLSQTYPLSSGKGLGRFTGLRTLEIREDFYYVLRRWGEECRQNVEDHLETAWARMRELEGINPPMAGEACQVQWTTTKNRKWPLWTPGSSFGDF
jgi:2EXR family